MASQLILPFLAKGDQVSVTAIPEAYYAQTGERLFYADERIWVFKHNPFIDFRLPRPDDHELCLVPDARVGPDVHNYLQRYNSTVFGSQTEFLLSGLGLNGGLLRHPKLYAHDDSDIVPHKVVVHTTGSDRRLRGESRFWPDLEEDHIRVMSDEVIAALRRNYRNWMIVQIGAEDDKPIEADNVIDLRGKLDLWETAAEIASASRFIGVNSGPMHIANCYPRVSKRIVLMEFSQNYFQNRGSKLAFPFRAGDVRNLLTSWLDPANTYFNRFGHDLGITSSFSKV